MVEYGEHGKERISSKSRRVKNARLNAMFDAHKKGKTDYQSLETAADLAEKREALRRGERSERRFLKLAHELPIVKEVRKGSIDDDLRGIDAHIQLIESEGLPNMPVQIKSSLKGIERFMKSDNFNDLNGLIFCLNCNWNINKKTLLMQIRSEVTRIKNIRANQQVDNQV